MLGWNGCPEFDSNLLDRQYAINKKNHDWLHLGVGDEGSGKSTLGLYACKVVDPTFNIDRIVFDLRQFRMALKTAKRGNSIMCDELAEIMYSRDWNTRDSIELAKYLMICRYRGLHLWMNIPRVEYADIYVRQGRLSSMTKTFTVLRKTTTENGERYWRERGMFAAFTKETVINYFNKGYYLRSYFSNGYEKFPNMKKLGDDERHLVELYEAKKDDFGSLRTENMGDENERLGRNRFQAKAIKDGTPGKDLETPANVNPPVFPGNGNSA